jgi:hypothetical protein
VPTVGWHAHVFPLSVDGRTWHRVTLTGAGGTCRAAFTATAGSYLTLRVTAADAAGGGICETIIRALQDRALSAWPSSGHGRVMTPAYLRSRSGHPAEPSVRARMPRTAATDRCALGRNEIAGRPAIMSAMSSAE